MFTRKGVKILEQQMPYSSVICLAAHANLQAEVRSGCKFAAYAWNWTEHNVFWGMVELE